MSVIDTLFHIFEGSQPENGTAENKKKAEAIYAANKDNIQGVLGSLVPPAATPATNEAPISMANSDVANLNVPSANTVPAPTDVAVSDNTVTQNGKVGDATPPAQPLPLNPGMPPIQDQPPVNAAPTPPTTPPVTAPVGRTPAEPTPAAPDALANAITAPASNDNDARNAMLADVERKKKLGLIPNALGGIADAIGNAAKPFGGQGSSGNQDAVMAEQKEEEASQKGEFESKIKNDPNSDISKAYRSMVLEIAPDLAKNPDFLKMSAQSIGDKLPLIDTVMKAKASADAKKVGMAQAKSTHDLNLGLRQDQQQDRLEQNARMGVQNLRGDKSLARAEEQRDAAIVAYNRLDEIEKSGKGLNPVDYTDILGQIYKARTGQAPGEQVLNEIRQATAKGKIDKAYTFVTGQQAPATTQDITKSLKNMAMSMGNQADKFHEGYMKAHLIKPSGLDDARWEPIANTGRGVSFADATKQSASANNAGTDSEAVEWARQNPNDPRAAKILQLHGVQ